MDIAAKQRSYSSFKDFSNQFRLGAEGEMVLAFMMEVADKYAMYARGEGFEKGSFEQMKKDNETWSYSECGDKHFYTPFGELTDNPYKRYM